MHPFFDRFSRKQLIVSAIVLVLLVGGFFLFWYIKDHKTMFAVGSLNLFQKVTTILPIAPDTKKEIEVVNTLVSELTKQDDVERKFLVLLQNSDELRPGGGFLGQYAIVKVKNGNTTSTFVEDANLLDQRIVTKITPPYPLVRYAQIKKWKFRDSNFSPDFPTNAQKAEYFYRLAGGREQFDGVIAVNSNTFNNILGLTGPVQIPGDPVAYTQENGAYKLEERVEKAYLGEDVPAELKQNRKTIMKKIAAEIMSRAVTVPNIPKLAELAQSELRNKDVMLYFKDPNLQSLVESVHWDGSVQKDWESDYLMVVDANLGALKSDYYVKRKLDYTVDFTGDKPVATVRYTYNHTATQGDWRTSDYHTYTRVIAPLGSKYVDESRLKTGGVTSTDDAQTNKTVFGYKVDALIGQTLETGISYELPSTVTADNYRLLIQKQSGIGELLIKLTIKTKNGEYTHEENLQKDGNFSIGTIEEKQ